MEALAEQTVEASGLDLPALRKAAEESLYLFAKGVLGFDWLDKDVHVPICDRLEDVTRNRKIIVLPRGWLKTTICSIAFPIWLSVKRPNIRVLITQNSHANACKKLSVIAQQWETNPILRAMYPELLPNRSSTWKADSLCLTRTATFPESTYEAAGTSTKVVSRHYDVVIEDDTVAPDFDELGVESLAPTHDDVQKAIGWHRTNVLPLLNNPSTDLVLIVGTRWYDQDLIRWVMDNEPQYEVLTRACKEDADGKPDVNGTITYPSRFNQDTLDGLEAALGPYMYSCNPAEAPILMGDFRSRNISEVKAGDTVIGFTTNAGEHSRLVYSKVLETRSRTSPIVEVVFKSGRKIRCTPDHHWLNANEFKKRADVARKIYSPARVGMSMAFVYNPFDENVFELNRTTRQAERESLAWLGGMFDGEGNVTRVLGSGRLSIAQSQRYNPQISDMIRRVMHMNRFVWSESKDGDQLVFGLTWEDRRRFMINVPSVKTQLGIPPTLLSSRWIKEKDEIISVTPCGAETVYSLQTETGNYICWGYASKNCLYMNTPVRSEDMMFKTAWFQYYERVPRAEHTAVYTTVDVATDPKLAKGKKVDYNVVMTTAKDMSSGHIYVLDYFRKRCNPGELAAAIFDHVVRFRPIVVGYEDVAYQRSIEYWLKELMRAQQIYFILESMPRTGRDAKDKAICALQPLFASGTIFLRPHMKELMSELLKYPLGDHDDTPDALSMQLRMWKRTRTYRAQKLYDAAGEFTLEGAMASIEARRKGKVGSSVIFDPIRHYSLMEPHLVTRPNA